VPGANIGKDAAVFEAVHGTAPDIAGKGFANPTALLQSGIMMLRHMGETLAAAKVEKALIEHFQRSSIRTRDLGGKASTTEFAEALANAVAKA
jgi:isocitrate dehydrogenase (NAD+)